MVGRTHGRPAPDPIVSVCNLSDAASFSETINGLAMAELHQPRDYLFAIAAHGRYRRAVSGVSAPMRPIPHDMT